MPSPQTNSVDSSGAESTERSDDRAGRSKRRRPLRSFFIIVGIGYLALLASLLLMEPRLVYPGAYMTHRPHSTSTSMLDVEYKAADGVPLTGRILERPDCKHTVLFFHGNGEKARWLDGWAMQLSQALDATVMIAEYRGFADTDQTPNEKGILLDCISARDFLCQRQGLRPQDIVLFGRSLGGGCAVAVAARGGAKALILDRTFDRIVDIAAARFPFVPVRWMMNNRYDSIDRINQFQGPLIQLHGTTDQIIPLANGKNLYSSYRHPSKHWIEVSGLGHNDPLPASSLDHIANKLDEFVAQDAP